MATGCAAAASLAVAGGGSAGGQTAREEATFVPGEAIVRFEPGTAAARRRQTRDAAGVSFERALDTPRTQLVGVEERSVPAAVAALERQPGVAFAQPNFVYRKQGLSSDPNAPQLWGLNNVEQVVDGSAGAFDVDVNAPEAWARVPGRGQGELIAIVDTGIALDHPDLVGNLWTNPGEVAGDGVDNDGNGVVDDVRGADFVDRSGDSPTGDPDDADSHGSHVTGIAAAVGGNNLGGIGAAPGAQAMAVRVLDARGQGTSADIADGVRYAVDEGASVINMSLGGPGQDSILSAAVDHAAAADVVVVVAAGNDDRNNNDLSPVTPCVLPQPVLICVAAIDSSGNLASFSNFGPTTVDVGAPGVSVLSSVAFFQELFEDDFDGPATFADNWDVAPPTADWATTTEAAASGPNSATDSPGGNYAANSESYVDSDMTFDLSSRTGCRLNFQSRLDIAAGDLFVAGVVRGNAFIDDEAFQFEGETRFFDTAVPLPGADGEADLKVSLGVDSGDDSVQGNGAYVDDVAFGCRAPGPPQGVYEFFDGTSMSTPHVSGIAALVRAADECASATEVAIALREGVKPLGSLATSVASGGISDAVAAIDAAQALESSETPRCPDPPVTPDTDAPRISGVGLSRKRFRVGNSRTPVSAQRRRRTPTGTRIRFRLSEPAASTLAFQRKASGRRKRVRGRLRCVKPTRRLVRRGARRCTRFLASGKLRRKGAAGANRVAFSGRIGLRRLRPGRYRLTITAVDEADNASAPARRSFKIVRR